MTVSFVLMVNKQGQTRLSQYVDWLPMKERNALESEIIRKCLSRNENQCSFVEYRGYKVVYRRYASLFFIVGTKDEVVRAAVFCFLGGMRLPPVTHPFLPPPHPKNADTCVLF